MKMRFAFLLTFVALTLVSFASKTLACSYADGALFPSSYDYVKQADAIVLAEPSSRKGSEIEFTIVEVLKGDFIDSVAYGFELNTSCSSLSFPFKLESTLLEEVAKRIVIEKPKYLLFFQRIDGQWRLDVSATEHYNVPITKKESSATFAIVKQLTRIASINDYETEKLELKKLNKLAKNGKVPDFYSAQLSKMIDDHFSTPTPNKSYRDLIDIYNRFDKDTKRKVLWSLANGKHAEGEGFIFKLLASSIPTNYIGPISLYISETKNESLLVRLGRNYPELDKSSRWPLMWAMIKTADERHVGMMMDALRSANSEEASRLIEWFVRHPNREALEIARTLVGGKYQENWELSFGLAGMGDNDTLLWAKDFMNTSDKDRWMAYYIIAKSPLEEADRLARRVIETNSPDDLSSLIQGYEESRNPNRYDRLRDIAEIKNKDAKVSDWLKRTLDAMVSNGDVRASELLEMLKK